MRLVVAVGGNALLHRGEAPDADVQQRRIADAARALAPLASEHELVLCHGNGPQVGLLALESAADATLSRPYPLDVLVAETQGAIGCWFARELRNAEVTRPPIALVSQALVSGADPAFRSPSKFIGPTYASTTAERLAGEHGWTVKPDGDGWRRVVPSPIPHGIVEVAEVDLLLSAGRTVICGGGGGVPVVVDSTLRAVEAVVDKDMTAARLAVDLFADRLVILTDVEGVHEHFGDPDDHVRCQIRVDEIDALGLPSGSMGPKVDACGWFVRATGRDASIGALSSARAVLQGTSGTRITPASGQGSHP